MAAHNMYSPTSAEPTEALLHPYDAPDASSVEIDAHLIGSLFSPFPTTDLDDAESAVHDCVVPLSAELGDDGWGNVSDAEVISRIYSPTNPAAIDVFLEYHYRTRYSSVEFHCNIFYRMHVSIIDPKLNIATPSGPGAPSTNAFNSETSALAGKISVREMLRLFLASVGIASYAADDD
ncbi:hypothetical protein FB451DRAFT_1392759 [Mycena latifolia]|nr:hypothetical protein FB451DRAFT_1392759 [Mycena latifolia]